MVATPWHVSQLVLKIRRYLQAHPHAADNVEGVAGWWLAGDPHNALEAVELALDQLVSEGAMRKQVLADGKTVYASALADRDGSA